MFSSKISGNNVIASTAVNNESITPLYVDDNFLLLQPGTSAEVMQNVNIYSTNRCTFNVIYISLVLNSQRVYPTYLLPSELLLIQGNNRKNSCVLNHNNNKMYI